MATSMKMLLITSAVLMTCFLFREGEGHIYSKKKKPNILFIMVKDLGWMDLGVHDSNLVTPTIDRLYSEGFRFNFSYADPSGSSSRAAFFSGKFSYKMGLQDNAINKFSGAHVPTSHKLLPEALRYQGYRTHMIGTWDQGFCNLDQTPTYRGFDTFYGHYTNSVNYTTKKTEEGYYDFRDGEEVMSDNRMENMYNTDVLTKRALRMISSHKRKFPDNEHPFFIMLSFTAIEAPNDVPAKYVRKCRKGVFNSEERKLKCGMLAALDKSIFKIVRLLEKKELDHDTLIFFTSDSGGDTEHGSSNWPLRGSKGTVWEGGIRVPSFIWSDSSTLLPVQNHTYAGLFHMVDWYPTIIGFAKRRGRVNWPAKIAPAMDGRNHWRLIKRGVKKSFRTEFAYMVNETDRTVAYIRQGDFKLVIDEVAFKSWYNPPPSINASEIEDPKVNYNRKPFLMFNIKKDPYERRDLSRSKVPRNAAARETLLDLWEDTISEYTAKVKDEVDTNPANHPEYNDVWSPGAC